MRRKRERKEWKEMEREKQPLEAAKPIATARAAEVVGFILNRNSTDGEREKESEREKGRKMRGRNSLRRAVDARIHGSKGHAEISKHILNMQRKNRLNYLIYTC